MEAIVLNGPMKYEFTTNFPIPEIKDDEVLVRVKATGICGTDVELFHGSMVFQINESGF